MKNLSSIGILASISVLFLIACGRTVKNNSTRVDYSPEWSMPVQESSNGDRPIERTVEPERLDYEPKTSFTSMAFLEELIPEDNQDFELGCVNRRFITGCYYTGDISTPFLASFSERWNRMQFFRRFMNAWELFERGNDRIADTLSTETVRGNMPMLQNEIQLAFKDTECRKKAKKLVKMLTTIDCTDEDIRRLADLFNELVNMPNKTRDFLSEEDSDAIEQNFWALYDKSLYVEDIDTIQRTRVYEDALEDDLTTLGNELKHRYVEEKDFDARCILALEIGCCGDPDAIDYLGELIEDGRYSMYLFEVWYSWRLRVQSEVFGISTYSEIPDNLYDKARLQVARSFLRHISECPDDKIAQYMLIFLTYTENLRRTGGYYGNEAMGAHLYLRSSFFLPDKIMKRDE